MFTAYKHDYIENNASPFFSLLFYIDVFYVINKAVSMLSMQFLCILQRATVLQNVVVISLNIIWTLVYHHLFCHKLAIRG